MDLHNLHTKKGCIYVCFKKTYDSDNSGKGAMVEHWVRGRIFSLLVAAFKEARRIPRVVNTDNNPPALVHQAAYENLWDVSLDDGWALGQQAITRRG